jgi:signal transduction histidine kinase
MSRLPIRARIAPIALAVVFGFVVIGFLRADREMVRAERDRAALVASETAALVEVFLLRHAGRMRDVAERLRATDRLSDAASGETTGVIGTATPATRQFESIWIVDSAGMVHTPPRSSLGDAAAWVKGGGADSTTDSVVLRELADARRAGIARPFLEFTRHRGHRLLLFGEPLGTNAPGFIVGAISADTLAAMLQREQRVSSFGIQVTSATDTIVWIPSPSAERRLVSVRDSVETPTGSTWTISMLYAPSGRGVRIALWIVGLGAVIGLGVGLLLERREASRIADRSSELEHLSAELLRANRAKSEFLANVSHELRTPLNAIVGFVDLLRDGVYGALNPRQVGPVERIEASANHLRHLVDQVLDLAKMAAGRLEVHTEPVELRPFVFDVASEVEPLITEKGLTFSLAVAASLPRVRTDPTHLRQILINLLGNAVKFTSKGGISVRGRLVGAHTPGGASTLTAAGAALRARSPRQDQLWVALQVVDSGLGIPEKDHERIFDEFEQVNAGPRGDSMKRGTGLGLSISRRLARLLGGDITVESELGRGSVFTVWLPVDPAALRGDRAA